MPLLIFGRKSMEGRDRDQREKPAGIATKVSTPQFIPCGTQKIWDE